MIRGTTPKIEVVLPFDTDLLAEAWITLSQNKTEVLTKCLSECDCGERMLTVRLTQEETLRLACECRTEIQVRVRTKDGDALASNIFSDYTDRILKDGEI